MAEIAIVDVTNEATFALIPPCADPGFDHRTCDYWEDPDRGSKAARASWLEPPGESKGREGGSRRGELRALFPDEEASEPSVNPFAPPRQQVVFNPFAPGEEAALPIDNPFAPRRPARPAVSATAPRKLQLLARGLAVFGSYAKVLLLDGRPAAYAQFGPLSAYPRAQRLRELYPQLPASPAPAVLTCIATTAEARHRGLARRLVEAVCDDLATRGFAAVEAYPEVGARPDATSAASPAFWLACRFQLAVDDPRFPVVRRELR